MGEGGREVERKWESHLLAAADDDLLVTPFKSRQQDQSLLHGFQAEGYLKRIQSGCLSAVGDDDNDVIQSFLSSDEESQLDQKSDSQI